MLLLEILHQTFCIEQVHYFFLALAYQLGLILVAYLHTFSSNLLSIFPDIFLFGKS